MTVEHDGVAARRREVEAWYSGHRWKCKHFEDAVRDRLQRLLDERRLTDARVETRTKSVRSFVDKACKAAGDGFKYQDPRREITDAVGARVMVPLVTDVEAVRDAIVDRFNVEEESERGAEEGNAEVPGYRSLHLLVRLTDDDLAQRELSDFGDMVVEIQVRTILQHAWAALQHDLNYKAERPPSPALRRRITALAGLLELADREFVEVKRQQTDVREAAPTVVAAARPSPGRLTTASLRVYVEEVMGEEDPAAHAWYEALRSVLTRMSLASADDVTQLLGPWRERGPAVGRVIRESKPWVSSAVVFDMLLRLAAPEKYFADGCAAEDLEPSADLARVFRAELAGFESS